MLNQWLTNILRMPKLLLGFIVIVIVLLILLYQDPPTTLCDIQMEGVNKRLSKGFYTNTSGGSFQKSVMHAFQFCLDSNSSGGCHDMFSRLDFFEKQVATIPTECGGDKSTVPIRKALEKALRLFNKIGWGEKPPVNQYNKTAWLDPSDLGLFCRLKRQYQRLYGKEVWTEFVWKNIPTLPEANTLSKKKMWRKSLFSYPCKGLY